MTHARVCVSQRLFYALFQRVQQADRFDRGFRARLVKIQVKFDMLNDRRARLGCSFLQTGPEERHDRPGLWRGICNDDIHCGLGCLRHYLLCETSHPQEVGKDSINVGIESCPERHRELIV